MLTQAAIPTQAKWCHGGSSPGSQGLGGVSDMAGMQRSGGAYHVGIPPPGSPVLPHCPHNTNHSPHILF